MIASFFTRSVRAAALSSAAVAVLAPAAALAQNAGPVISREDPAPTIVVNDGTPITPGNPGAGPNPGPGNNPAPGGFDNARNVTGVGQMLVPFANGASFSLGLCTGTLINPRTVIFAAHCVNDAPASSYGHNSGGQAIAFAFNAHNNDRTTTTSSALRAYIGFNPGSTFGATDVALNLYDVERVWYDERSLDGNSRGFIQADVALATLDTPARNIPTWAMLFSALTGPTHVTINGYGANGTGTTGSGGIDYRRRIAENTLSVLGSLNDVYDPLFGVDTDPDSRLPEAALYQTDFDSPGGANRFDFDIFAGAALPNEGNTAGGDSGGPLFVDQKFDRTVLAGVLSGGSRFFAAQPPSSYGGTSFYQPLFLYWDLIVANNPYVYASNRGGNRNWADPANWIQLMDPNYLIEVNGQLVNTLPKAEAQGISNNSPRFGQVCIEGDCSEINAFRAATGTGGDGTPPRAAPFIPGGPGSVNFVPDNVVGTGTRKARYFDITLGQRGTTTVTNAYTVDVLTVTNGAGLTLGANGNMNVLGEYTQVNGATTFASNGRLTSGGDAFFMTGTVGGTGTLTAPFITFMQVGLQPGGNRSVGTLNLAGSTIFTSATQTVIDYGRTADLIRVLPNGATPSLVSLGGTVTVVPTAGTQPVYGQFLPILTATSSEVARTVSGTFDRFVAGGVITVTPRYEAQRVLIRVDAARFGSVMTGASPQAAAIANALDGLRYTNYANLSSVFGAVDYLGGDAMAAAFDTMAPRIVDEAASLEREQGRATTQLVADRLSLLGTRNANQGRLTLIGAPDTVLGTVGQTQLTGASASQLSFAGMTAGGERTLGKLPANMSGFVAGGYTTTPGYAGADRAGWNMAMGLEMEAAPDTSIGTAFAYSHGRTAIGGSQSESETSQAMAYGAHQLGRGLYVGGLASVAVSQLGVQRRTAGLDVSALGTEATITSYALRGEAGVNLEPIAGLTLTPRVSVAYEHSQLDGYRERGNQFGLIVDGMRDARMVGRVGAKLTGTVGRTAGWRFSPEARFDYVKTLAGGATSYDVRFAAAPELAFALPLAGFDRNWAEAQAGFRLAKDRMSFGAGAQSSIGRDQYRDDRAVVDFTLAF